MEAYERIQQAETRAVEVVADAKRTAAKLIDDAARNAEAAVAGASSDARAASSKQLAEANHKNQLLLEASLTELSAEREAVSIKAMSARQAAVDQILGAIAAERGFVS